MIELINSFLKLPMQIKISLVKNNKDNYPVDYTVSYERLKKLLTTFTETPKDKTPGIISGHFSGKRRLTENVHSKSLLFLDIDYYNSSINDLEVLFRRDLDVYRYIAYSTSSHSSKAPRIRLVLFLLEEVEAASYKSIASSFINSLSPELKNTVNIAPSVNPNYLMYLPTKPHEDYEPWYTENAGIFIDPKIYQIENYNTPVIPLSNDKLLETMRAYRTPYTEEEICRYLKFYPVSLCEYSDWITVGQALHHQYEGKEEGLSIWDKWSADDDSVGRYKGIEDLRTRWDGFGNTKNPVTFATILYRIKQRSRIEDIVSYKPIDPFKWAHTKGKYFKPIFTEENFHILLKEYNIQIHYDVIKKVDVIKINGKVQTDLNGTVTHIKLLCSLNQLSVTLVTETIHYIAQKNTINSWKDWIDSKEWDGIDRFEEFCNTVTVDPSFLELRNIYLKQWLLQMLHMTCLNDEEVPKSARFVLIFQGKQDLGKTTWLSTLAPKHMRNYILIGHLLDSSDDMNVLACIQRVFVELGEVTSTFRKSDMEALKNFISKPIDALNRKYLGLPMEYRRTTVFFATTNETNFLSDKSGNTRFMVLPVLDVNLFHDVDMQQLYAQLLQEAINIGHHYFDKEKSELQSKGNETFESISVIEEKFLEIFNIEDTDCNEIYTATKVLEELGFNITQMNNKKNTINEMASLLNRYNFKKSSKPKGWYLPPKKEYMFEGMGF